MLDWLRRLLGGAPIHGDEGYKRGHSNTAGRIRCGMTREEAATYWINAYPPQDDYDRGVLDALGEGGFVDPDEGPQ